MSWLSTYYLTDDMELTGINVDIAQELVLLWGKCSDKKKKTVYLENSGMKLNYSSEHNNVVCVAMDLQNNTNFMFYFQVT